MRLRELRGPLLFTFGLALAFELGLRAVAGIGWITLVPGDIHGFDRLTAATTFRCTSDSTNPVGI